MLDPHAAASLPSVLPPLFTLALTWSLGATCDGAGRAAFDAQLRGELATLAAGDSGGSAGAYPAAAAALAESVPAAPPAGAAVYDWVYEPPLAPSAAGGSGKGRGWVRWMEVGPTDYKCDPDKRFSQLVVPTVDTVGGEGCGTGTGGCVLLQKGTADAVGTRAAMLVRQCFPLPPAASPAASGPPSCTRCLAGRPGI